MRIFLMRARWFLFPFQNLTQLRSQQFPSAWTLGQVVLFLYLSNTSALGRYEFKLAN